MPSNRQLAIAKLRSMRNSLFEAITELQVQATAAADRGQDDLSSQLSLRAIALTKESVRLRRAEDAIRAQMPITATVHQLSGLADQARNAVRRLRTISELLANTTSLVNIIRRLTPLLG